ncbi:MAG TPA: response regulator [Beijerinckiaceae bacterium]|nr:response regulator [Beijerinckiaceae bacterium]
MEEKSQAPVILLVEPDVLVLKPLAEYLRQCGYDVLEAKTREEAIGIVKERPGIINILLSDVHTPGTLDGYGLANWIRANRPSVDIVLAGTPVAAANEAAGLCEEGPQRSKPYDHALLLDRIKKTIAAREHKSL